MTITGGVSEKVDDHRGSVDSGVTISTLEILPEKNVEYFEKALEHLSEYRSISSSIITSVSNGDLPQSSDDSTCLLS